MKLQLIHLSDMHFSKKTDPFEIQIDKIVQSMNAIGDADECILVLSGDLAASGRYNEYRYVSSLVGAISKTVREEKFNGKHIEVICVPGNHDVFFPKIAHVIDDITSLEGDINTYVEQYLSGMEGFFNFARHRKCFLDDKIVSKRILIYGEKKVGFVMLNSAPLSMLGGNAEDMGRHYLSDEQIVNIENATEADINVLVMHHNIEWFNSSCKDRLRKIISKKYSLVLTGHEHEPVGESRNINGTGEVQYVQGNALCGYATDGNGFCVINLDFGAGRMVGHSLLWNESFYVPKKILDAPIKDCIGRTFIAKREFIETIDKDRSKRRIDDYYVFPSLTYNTYKENEEVEKHDVETESDLMEVVQKYNKIVISGEHRVGKTLLANRMFRTFLSQGKTPLLLTASDANKKKIDRIVEYAFYEQYDSENDAYELFKQIHKNNKIVLLDEANLIPQNILNTLLKFLEDNFGKIIVFSEEKIDFDIKKQVVDMMIESDTLNMMIKPFLYVKRKKLISNILSCDKNRERDIDKETQKINELINAQIKYFNLNPEFIISFVNQYERDYRFQFSSGLNVFNIVYESSIRNRIIANSENVDVTTIINVLRELAFYMHFAKKNFVGIYEISNVIEKYKQDYRQKVNIRSFIDATIKAKILDDADNEIRFKDHTLVAYFVAQALNQKYHQDEDIKDDLEYLLKNLCFSINSDIVLFLALITNNPKFVNIIINGAKKHFEQQEELSFDAENVKFLLDTTIPVKNSLPNEEERKQREEVLAKQEEDVKLSDLVELVNEYDYSEEDLLKIENQIMISFKYLEILSKTLPAFCQNMKVEQQDVLVSLIYKCPNQFLFKVLRDIGDNFEGFCNEVYEDISVLRQEKNIAEVNIDSVKHMIEQISAVLIMALYQVVASTCTSEQTIAALNSFDFNLNSNYKLQNLMMISRVTDVSTFSRRAQELKGNLENKIEKSIIKHTVREYLLRNNVEIYGEAQSLIDCFFGGQTRQKLKMEIAKRRIIEKDRT